MSTGREIGQHGKPGTSPEPTLRDFAFNMQVYEASIQYHLVRLGDEEPLDTPEKLVRYMDGAFDGCPVQESFYVVCLNQKSRPLSRTRITIGTLTATMAHPREIFRLAILASAARIMVVHQHPSGDPAPSVPDHQVTKLLHEAGKIMQIELVDHVIIGTKEDDPHGRGYFSFRSAGLLGGAA